MKSLIFNRLLLFWNKFCPLFVKRELLLDWILKGFKLLLFILLENKLLLLLENIFDVELLIDLLLLKSEVFCWLLENNPPSPNEILLLPNNPKEFENILFF